MELSEQLKKYRKQSNLTQRELALKLNVSDKTISSWETGRTYPDISMLINLSSILKVSLDEFLKGDFETVQKIDKDLKLKRVYKKWLIAILVLVFAVGGVFYFLSTYQYKNVMVDRFNPLLETKIGYAALPTEKNAIASDYENVKDSHGKTKKILGSPYKNMVVTDNAWGDSSFLTFYGGLAPKNKSYAMVKHRGSYVARINFVDWESIPKSIRNNMYRDYEKYRGMYQIFKESQKEHQGTDTPVFTMQTGKY
ncbi:helix-turn-helix domain-containing protein [Companilactobacillus pabuli]|jgi:transcriptional regulator with XRE-family HTH domain|uniref:Helix-turn-helix domain-containing protein n=1 Tax=Companilactobacillus pabuli TaxID=2714036 RepID=A0A7L7KX25_9LACO|nr:helix-turn-helix domain-containing protein [Companilactobacillus pabuli]MDG5112577.1 helix-turn-helix domain-containing protein [Companilactobacillus pabuli]QMT83544.1 helix-turn-helix domain-containing protein [Companilactobacillus pabuli]GAQ01164.1 XRE family transcriptional regulator [Companilactobacillus farciminis]